MTVGNPTLECNCECASWSSSWLNIDERLRRVFYYMLTSRDFKFSCDPPVARRRRGEVKVDFVIASDTASVLQVVKVHQVEFIGCSEIELMVIFDCVLHLLAL